MKYVATVKAIFSKAVETYGGILFRRNLETEYKSTWTKIYFNIIISSIFKK